MRGHAIHSAEVNVSLQVKPDYQPKATTLLARCCEQLLCNVLPTLLIAVCVGSLTLMLCEQIDKAKHARELLPAISTMEAKQNMVVPSQ